VFRPVTELRDRLAKTWNEKYFVGRDAPNAMPISPYWWDQSTCLWPMYAGFLHKTRFTPVFTARRRACVWNFKRLTSQRMIASTFTKN